LYSEYNVRVWRSIIHSVDGDEMSLFMAVIDGEFGLKRRVYV